MTNAQIFDRILKMGPVSGQVISHGQVMHPDTIRVAEGRLSYAVAVHVDGVSLGMRPASDAFVRFVCAHG